MKILVVDDFVTNVSILRITLTQMGHAVVTARDGNEAIAVLKTEPIDVVMTDWMMPRLDGIGLIRWIRSSLSPQPGIIVVTALRSAEAEAQALEAGADAFLIKPVLRPQLSSLLAGIHAHAPRPAELKSPTTLLRTASAAHAASPKFCAVGFGAGTGGAQGVRRIFKAIGAAPNAAFFIVLHGPAWAAEALAEQMKTQLLSNVVIPKDGEKIRSGAIYIARGDAHMTITSDEDMSIRYVQTPPENFHRPSIDPLFRSLADVFGRRAIGVVLAGTGTDGYIGAGHLQVAHGTVIAQEPTADAASQMSQNVIALGLASLVLPLEKISDAILEQLRKNRDVHSAIPASIHTESRA